eukprot:1279265-Rhodomonas_salina.1
MGKRPCVDRRGSTLSNGVSTGSVLVTVLGSRLGTAGGWVLETITVLGLGLSMPSLGTVLGRGQCPQHVRAASGYRRRWWYARRLE